jgi:hypothetical protein
LKLVLRLAAWTVKRTPLSLNDSLDDTAATANAGFAFAVIDKMVVLIAAFAVDCVAVSAVRQRRAFVLDGLSQNTNHFSVDVSTLSFREFVATSLRIDFGSK